MAIVTLRADHTVVNTMALTGASSAHAASNDNTDASYFEAPFGSFSETILGLPDYPIPSNAYLKQVRVRVRYRTVDPYTWSTTTYWVVRFITSTGFYGASQSQSTISASPVESIGGWQAYAPSGAPWSQAELNALQVDIYPGYYTGFNEMPRIYEVYVDLDINYSPTTTITSPANNGTVTTTRPPVTFTYQDTEGDAMEAYRAKLFNSSQYNASGFDPNTWAPLYDTGKVGTYSPPQGGVVAPFDLLNTTSYRWYVWVYQQGGPQGTTGFGVSVPNTTTFTVNVAPPALPVITVTPNVTGGYISLTINSGGGTPATSSILVERSQDGGVTWSSVRGTPVAPGSTVVDFEVIPNKWIVYRGRSVASNGIASVWSAPTPQALVADNEWRLRDPLDSTRNMVLSVIGDNIVQQKPEDKAFFAPMGRTRKVAVADVIRGEESTLTLEFLTEGEYLNFERLRNSQRTLYLVRGWTSEAWYIQFDQIREMTLHNFFPTYRTVTISWIEMDAP